MDMKGISWVGNIYQKFEAMCLEMEEVMYQDTVRYVENQVQTVGASVKRFYSDVMLDMHPHCNIDPVKVAAADLSRNPYAHTEIIKKLKANIKGHSPRGITKKLIDDTQVIKGKSKNGGVYRRQNVGIKEIVKDRDSHHPSTKSDAICLGSRDAIKFSSVSKVKGDFEVASDCMTMTLPSASVKGHDSVVAAKGVYNHIMDTNGSAAGILSNAAASDTSLSVESVGKSQPDLRNTAVICDLQSDSHDRHTDKELAGETGSEISSNTHNAEVAREEINKSREERTDRYCSTTLEKYDLNESDVEIVEQFDEPNLEETCVLVEGGRLHIPQGSVKRKSYKKKLREVFSMKKKSTRKEYEQLGTLHGDQQPNLEAEDKVMQILAADTNTKNLSANDHSESEWELL